MNEARESGLHLLADAEVFAPEPRGRCSVLVAGGRIAWIGARRPELDPALGAEVLDLGGARLVPGLVDAHVHVAGGGGEAGAASKVPAVPLTRFTRAGVTTVVGLLGTDDTTRTTAELLAAARALEDLGLSAWCWTGGYHVPPATLTGDARRDVACVDRILGIGEVAISDHRSSQPTAAELARLAADAHVAGLMTGKAGVLHLHVGDGPRGLDLVRQLLAETELPPRVFHPTHVNRRQRLFEEAIELARAGVTIDVTAFPVAEGDDAWPAARAIERYLELGAPPERITASSDGGGCLPRFDAEGRVASYDIGAPAALAETLAELLARGHPPERALPPFTSNPARLLRLSGKGRIAEGADADLVVLDAQHRVRDVMARGRWLVRGGRALVRGPFEEAAD